MICHSGDTRIVHFVEYKNLPYFTENINNNFQFDLFAPQSGS